VKDEMINEWMEEYGTPDADLIFAKLQKRM
jgi:hypothetical protein